MTTFELTTTALGVGLAIVIVVLVRHGHMQITRGGFWLVVAVLALVLGTSPRLVDAAARVAGISYAPSLLLLVAVVVLFIKALFADIASTQLERQLRRLNQRMAIYEAERGDDAPRASPRRAQD
ncbi:DUF2304 domain-containing protein [Thauera propionica]|jgi:hypothetical protein|uniref:DUF2304 domain-containing protein n=1 Tax=Thauera propionica TaxID=2019431 RepID=UPI0023F2D475|nr:DUF2304 domain-containing protein [Thauera propionica]MDD3675503.1 DUF2304 domain-containing protein [Thauera propionica]